MVTLVPRRKTCLNVGRSLLLQSSSNMRCNLTCFGCLYATGPSNIDQNVPELHQSRSEGAVARAAADEVSRIPAVVRSMEFFRLAGCVVETWGGGTPHPAKPLSSILGFSLRQPGQHRRDLRVLFADQRTSRNQRKSRILSCPRHGARPLNLNPAFWTASDRRANPLSARDSGINGIRDLASPKCTGQVQFGRQYGDQVHPVQDLE